MVQSVIKITALLLWILFVYPGCFEHANAKTLSLHKQSGKIVLGPYTQYIEDSDGDYSFEFIKSKTADSLWKTSEKENIGFGYTDSVYWVKVSFKNEIDRTGNYYFELGYPVLDYINVYVQSEDGQSDTLKLGDKLPFNSRPVQHRNFVFPVKIQPYETLNIFIRIKTSSAVQLPLHLYEELLFLETGEKHVLGLGFYYGSMIIMIIYNLFIFAAVREKHLLYYVLYVLCMAVFVSSLNGISFQYLWPESTWWNDQVIILSLGGLTIFACIFTISILKLSESTPKIYIVLSILAVLQCLNMMLSMYLSYRVSILSVIVIAIAGIFTAMYVGIKRLYDGYLPARFYVMAFFSMFLAGLILAMSRVNILPVNFLTEHSMHFGSILEVVLLSFALADRINNDKRERIKAQQHAHIQEKRARIANEKLLENQKKMTELLELEVQERTSELNINLEREELANKEITDSLNYARLIQLLILPVAGKIREWFSNHFIIWSPRDIVGGDFYYIDKLDGYKIIAIADCTGHGVPGAFLTMIASAELKRIFKSEKCFKPSEILNKLNIGIKETLKQDSGYSLSDDGVDLAVCIINQDKELTFAGARQNLYYTHENELHTLKGDKTSIGYIKTKTDIRFTEHTIKIKKGMKFYIPTDGVTDQLSKKTGRRFGTKKLKDFIIANQEVSLKDQPQKLLMLLANHREGRSVVDDVTLFAFSINPE